MQGATAKSLHGLVATDDATPFLALEDDQVTVAIPAGTGIVHAANSTAGGSKALTLPNAAESANAWLLILQTVDNGSGTIDVDDDNEARIKIGSAHQINVIDGFVLLYNPGGAGWIVIAEKLS